VTPSLETKASGHRSSTEYKKRLSYSVQVLGSAVERSSRAFGSLKTISSLTAIGRWVKNGRYAYRWRSFALLRRNDVVAPIPDVRGAAMKSRGSTKLPFAARETSTPFETVA
jgi:hypothetical protein